MYKIIDEMGTVYTQYTYLKEADFEKMFHNDPRLYLVEVELHNHDVYGHIGEQILRFGISTETDKYKIKNHLILMRTN